MTEFLTFGLHGVFGGCPYALIALGIVLTYRATGVFNFAFAAQAFAAAVLYAEMVANGISITTSALVAIVVVSPAIGLVGDLLFFSRIRRDDLTASVVVSLTLFVALPEVIQLAVGHATPSAPPPVVGSLWDPLWSIDAVQVSSYQVATLGISIAAMVVVGVLFRFTRLGLEMRASVESTRLLQLSGVNSTVVTAAAWAVSSMLAGLAGVLYAPSQYPIEANNFWILFVLGVAAAVAGGFKSLLGVFSAGIGLGVVTGLLQGYIVESSTWQTLLNESVPYLLLAVLVVVHPSLREVADRRDPLAGVDPPIEVATQNLRRTAGSWPLAVIGWLALGGVGIGALVLAHPTTLLTLSLGMATAIIMLSITLVTGLGGQLSLSQVAFAGIGAFTCAALHAKEGWWPLGDGHVPFFAGALAGGLVAALVGALVALGGRRLSGLPLMLLTFAFAVFCDNVAFQLPWFGNGLSGVAVPTPLLPGITFTYSYRQFFVLGVVVFSGLGFVVNRVRQGSVGLYLTALRESEPGARSLGIAPTRVRVTVFALAAGIAGIGGALFGSIITQPSAADFVTDLSALFLVAVCAIGSISIYGALLAGVAVAFATNTSSGGAGSGNWTSWGVWLELLLAIAALSYAWHPMGLLEVTRRRGAAAIDAAVARGRASAAKHEVEVAP